MYAGPIQRLIAEQKGLASSLDEDVNAVAGEDRPLFADFLALNRKHLAELESLAKEHAGKLASTVR